MNRVLQAVVAVLIVDFLRDHDATRIGMGFDKNDAPDPKDEDGRSVFPHRIVANTTWQRLECSGTRMTTRCTVMLLSRAKMVRHGMNRNDGR